MGGRKSQQNGKGSKADDSDDAGSEQEEVYKVRFAPEEGGSSTGDTIKGLVEDSLLSQKTWREWKVLVLEVTMGFDDRGVDIVYYWFFSARRDDLIGVREFDVAEDYKKRKFFVKWENYPESQATWEPESNMIDCDDLIATFMESRPDKPTSTKKRSAPADGGAPDSKKVKKESSKSTKGAKADTEEETGFENGTNADDAPEFHYYSIEELPKEIRNLPSWDGLVELEHMEQNPEDEETRPGDRNPIVYLLWTGGGDFAGSRSRHESKDLMDRCPRTLVQYLVDHIKFRQRS
ncbi:hypothetical protein HDU93_003639 [Gonapodya sp. JEL0774]|nr:hypothetical protein HDU93_003639 [Gonapodya sp. JEL0774]